MHALLDALLDAGASFPTRPGTPWVNATHTVVHTVTGARYTFREHGARVYVTSSGSTAGDNLTNALMRGPLEVLVGVRMQLPHETWRGTTRVRLTSAVTGWERSDLMTGFTSTSVD